MTNHHTGTRADSGPRQSRASQLVAALIGAAVEQLPEPNPYIVRYLADHVADDDAWPQLAAVTAVLDRLDPDAVASAVLRSGRGIAGLPAQVAAVVAMRHILRDLDGHDRDTVRQIGAIVHGGAESVVDIDQGQTWRLRWAHLNRSIPTIGLVLGAESIKQLDLGRSPDGRPVLVTTGWNATVNKFDAATGELTFDPVEIEQSGSDRVEVRHADGRAFHASADITVKSRDDGLDLGIITIQGPNGDNIRISAHTGGVRGIVPLTLDGVGSLLASAGDDGAVRLWDVGAVFAAAPGRQSNRFPGIDYLEYLPRGGGWIAAGGTRNRTCRIYFHDAGDEVPHRLSPRRSLPTEHDTLNALTFVPDRRRMMLATAHLAGARLWSLDRRRPWTEARSRRLPWDVGTVRRLAALPRAEESTLVAGLAANGLVRIWDAASSRVVHARFAYRSTFVIDIATFPLPDGRTALAVLDTDEIRILDPASGEVLARTPAAENATYYHRRLVAVAVAGRHQLACIESFRARLWNPATGAIRSIRHHYAGTLTAAAALGPTDGDQALVLGTRTGLIDVWNPSTLDRVAQLRTELLILDLTAHGNRIVIGCGLGLLAVDVHIATHRASVTP